MKPFSDNSDTSYEYVIVNKQLERFVYDAGDEIKSRDCIPTYTHAFKKASHYYMNEYTPTQRDRDIIERIHLRGFKLLSEKDRDIYDK